MDNLYLENIEELLNDGNIVTFRQLSLTLKISSNVAKQMLFRYYDQIKGSEEEFKLSVTYLLTGVKYDNILKQDIYKVCIIHEDALENVECKFKKVFSLHIYSIQRTRLKDLHVLYVTDCDKMKENIFNSMKFSSITCPSLTAKEMCKNLVITEKLIKEECSMNEELIKKECCRNDTPRMREAKDVCENKENRGKKEKSKKSEILKEIAKGQIASMFANQTKKIKMQSSSIKSGLESDYTPKTATLKFHQTSQSECQLEDPGTLQKEKNGCPISHVVSNMTESNFEISSGVEIELKKVVKDNKITSKNKPVNSKRTSNSQFKGKRKPSESFSNTKSKRQRIVIMDSESSSEEEDTTDDCPIPSPINKRESDDESESGIINPMTSLSGEETLNSNNRRRKLVDKTHLDENGFLVTKKVYELVSDSDEENILFLSQVKEISPADRKRATPISSSNKLEERSPVKTKQSSLLSFFKKT